MTWNKTFHNVQFIVIINYSKLIGSVFGELFLQSMKNYILHDTALYLLRNTFYVQLLSFKTRQD